MNKVKMSTLSKEEQEREVAKNPSAINYVINQTEELCKIAVEENTYAIKYVINQTEELCKIAVQNGYAIQYVREQTEELCKLAVENNPSAIKYVINQTEELCKIAVQNDGYAIEHVNLEFITQEILDICKGVSDEKDWNDYNDYFQSLNAVEITKNDIEGLLGYKIKIIKEEK